MNKQKHKIFFIQPANKMGFDFNITLTLQLCPETGKPFYYTSSAEKGFYKEYTLPELNIPEAHKRFVQQRGPIFHVYTGMFSFNDIFTVDIQKLLDEFPDWEEVLSSDYYDENDDGWSEEDHNEFREALTWFNQQNVSFQASWSY